MMIISWNTCGNASVFEMSRDDCQKLRGRIEYLVCTLEFYKARDRALYVSPVQGFSKERCEHTFFRSELIVLCSIIFVHYFNDYID